MSTPTIPKEDALKAIQEIGERVKALVERLPPESSLQLAAFNLRCVCGELEARISSARATKEDANV